VDMSFIPTPDVAAILNLLLDAYERRGGYGRRAVRVRLHEVAGDLPGYYSQTDPEPRVTANEQLGELESRGLLALGWEPGQKGHLLEAVTLEVAEPLYALLKREPMADRRRRLRESLLADRFRLDGWRLRAVEHCLAQLKENKSPAPFSLADDDWNRDLLAALIALPSRYEDGVKEEIPYRVFSVRLFNDSKRFEALKGAIARLARRHQPQWRDLSSRETLRELGLVANPDHLYLYGPWRMIDDDGCIISLAEFHPSVGIPTSLVARLREVSVEAEQVICVENLTPFYELVRYESQGLAALCLWGNPSPAGRYLLRCLAQNLPQDIPLLLWADIDYGGFNILAQLREQVSPRFAPYRMDIETMEEHIHWAHPLLPADERNLVRLKHRPSLADIAPLIDHMLLRKIKLEQEALTFARRLPYGPNPRIRAPAAGWPQGRLAGPDRRS
jgi:hypothetical protein